MRDINIDKLAEEHFAKYDPQYDEDYDDILETTRYLNSMYEDVIADLDNAIYGMKLIEKKAQKLEDVSSMVEESTNECLEKIEKLLKAVKQYE